jgi:hypothetical protein
MFFLENILDFLTVVIEAQVELIVWLNIGDVRSFNVRGKVGDAKVVGISRTTCCIWMVERLEIT